MGEGEGYTYRGLCGDGEEYHTVPSNSPIPRFEGKSALLESGYSADLKEKKKKGKGSLDGKAQGKREARFSRSLANSHLTQQKSPPLHPKRE